MEQLSKYLPLLVVLALLSLLLVFLYSSSRLSEAIDRLEAAEETLSSTIQTLASARNTIDSVQHDLATFGSYVHDIQGRVEILDLSRRSEIDAFKNQRSKIADRLKILYRDVDITGQELPEIPVVAGASVVHPRKTRD